jgi:hypothetical protein
MCCSETSSILEVFFAFYIQSKAVATPSVTKYLMFNLLTLTLIILSYSKYFRNILKVHYIINYIVVKIKIILF